MSHCLKIGALILLLSTLGCTNTDNSLNRQKSLQARYENAEALLPVNLRKSIDNLYIKPHWTDDGGFWYQLEEQGKPSYFRYDKTSGINSLFDMHVLKEALGRDHSAIAIGDIKVNDFDGELLFIDVLQQQWTCRLGVKYDCTVNKENETNTLPLTSPDGRWQIIVDKFNLFLLDIHSGNRTQLSHDGTKDFPYATENPNPKIYFNQNEDNVEPRKVGYWSEDSRYFVTFQLDLRNVGKLQLMQSVTNNSQRPRYYSYHYPMAGDAHLIEGQMVLVDAVTQNLQRVATEPLLQTYYGTPLWGDFAENNKYYFLHRERGYHTYHLKELSPETGEVRNIVTETNDKFIDPWVQDFQIFPEQDMVLWTSERSGMQQLYRYRLSTTELVNAVTPENLFMRVVRAVDIDSNSLYFEGSGADDSDAYYRYLYRVNMDGSGLTLLTPETAMHDTRIAPDFSSFIDSYSTVQEPTRHVLRSAKNGAILATLHEVDNSRLLALGYTEPEPFSLLAPDGVTPLHGILYFPSDFNPGKKYPVLNDTYTGPHGYFTPKTYDGPLYSQSSALAELGFIVLKMDGRGTGKRDRKFHEYSYDNLAGGTDDHVWALRQLAKKRPYLDINRVGIFGFSAGGYDTVRAMYNHPDFFKVGVAASGNHDFRADKAGWNETWMGYPVEAHWDEQSNLTDAEKLQGRLLLAHGELDDNVHPAATLQLVDKLIKANKRFDFIMYPNMGHVLHYHPHFVKTRWDYFVEHLLGVQPLANYDIESMTIPVLAR